MCLCNVESHINLMWFMVESLKKFGEWFWIIASNNVWICSQAARGCLLWEFSGYLLLTPSRRDPGLQCGCMGLLEWWGHLTPRACSGALHPHLGTFTLYHPDITHTHTAYTTLHSAPLSVWSLCFCLAQTIPSKPSIPYNKPGPRSQKSLPRNPQVHQQRAGLL